MKANRLHSVTLIWNLYDETRVQTTLAVVQFEAKGNASAVNASGTRTPGKRASCGTARRMCSSIVSAAGESDLPWRRTTPTVRVSTGFDNSRRLKRSSGARCAASADMIETPTPRATSVSIVDVFDTRYRGSRTSSLRPGV